MKSILYVLLALALFACGGQAATPPATPTSPAPADSAALPKALGKPRVVVEYIVVHEKWVEKTMTPTPTEVSAWYESAAGQAAVPPRRERFDFLSKKEADAALAKSKKTGEPLARISVKTDAMTSAADEAKMNAAFDKLGMGDAVVVEIGKDFWVVMKKERPSDEAIERAYRKAKAHETAQKLSIALLSRLQKADADARAVIAEVVGEILGERAIADPDRPQPVVVDDDRLRHSRLAPKAKETVGSMLKTAKAGETVNAPVVDGPVSTVARALPPSDR